MKKIFKHLAFAALIAGVVTGCEKKEVLPFYKTGTAPVLSSSVTSVAAAPADSSKEVITFSWTNPTYATDSAANKYIVQIDSSGRNFVKAVSRTVTGKLSTAYTAKQLNDILIGYGFSSGTAYSMDVRVISSYANNNDQYTSNTFKLQMTPYKIPPKIPVPAELIIVGDASVGGWNNPAQPGTQAIAQKFSLLDETTYGGIFYLNGGAQYLMLPLSGNWDHKFGGTSKTGGDLLADGAVPGSNTPAPDADGWYKIIVDFQTGKYTVTPYSQDYGLPDVLVAVGGATDGSWDNNANNTQTFTRLNSVEFTQTLNLKANDAYLILPEPGKWDKKYGVADKTIAAAKLGGLLLPNGQDIPSPTEAGSYKIDLNFAMGTYKLTKQ